MAITNYKHLEFFDKNGDSVNFEYNSNNDLWEGTFYIPNTSVGLVESCQFFIMEKLLSGPTAQPQYGLPHIAGSTGSTSVVDMYWTDSEKEEFFLYSFDPTGSTSILNQSDTGQITFDIDSSEYGSTGATYTDMKVTSVINASANQVNVGFLPKSEDVFQRTLNLKDVERDIVFARLTFYGVSEGEDERLNVLLDNLGDNINNEDFKIFDFSDINEELPDYTKLNYKRKELALEFHNIFNTIGSYKSIINAIKYFGFDQVTIKEYWKNVDVDSKNYNKYRHVKLTDLFTDNPNFNTSESLIPSKYFKKTSLFGLFYDITRETGTYDDDGIPIVEETFLYSIEEVLIKLFALKNKLKNNFLPTNARIIDIVGELLVFAKYDINLWTDQHRVDVIDINIRPEVNVSPSQYGYIEDLRELQHLGCPIAPDLTIGGTHSLRVFDFVINDADEEDVFTIKDTITNNSITYETAEGETDAETILGLINSWNTSANYPFINFQVYAFGPTANGVIRVVEQFETDFDFDLSVVQGPVGGVPTITSTELFLGATAISNFANCFSGYFTRWQTPVKNLNDAPNIPVGYPIVLNNESFNSNWNDASLTWNSLDQTNADPGSSGYLQALYGPWINSIEITGSATGSVLLSVGVTGFPSSNYSSVNRSDGYWDWTTIERGQFHEMQWILTCTESPTTGASGWIYDSGIDTINALINHAVILPYEGKYKLEMKMWDLSNNITYLRNDDYIEVDLKESDMIGWYTQKELEYTWNDTEIKRVRSRNLSDSEKPLRPQQLITDPRKRLDSQKYLNWIDYVSTWDLPLQPNEEMDLGEMTYEFLDKVEFYHRIENSMEPLPDLVDLKSYTWNNGGQLNLEKDSEYVRWKDLDESWWDSTGKKLSRFEINGLGSTGPEISIHNIVRDKKSTYTFTDLGSTGKTGFIEAVDQLNKNAGASSINLDLLGATGSTFTPSLFDEFIFYYGERYDNTPFGSTQHPHNLVPYITAVSRYADSDYRYSVGYTGATGESFTTYTANFGTIGDAPLGFEIYKVASGPTGSITIGNDTYTIGSTTSTLIELHNELVGSTADGIKDYTYNIVIGQTGGTHSPIYSGSLTGVTGATTLGFASKIIATKKSYNAYDTETYSFNGGVVGTRFGRSVTSNISWNELRALKYTTELGRWSQVNFSYLNGGMHGKKNPTWELIRENDSDWVNIYYNGDYFSYLFNKSGSYTLNLTLEDTNGNTKKITKTELIKIK